MLFEIAAANHMPPAAQLVAMGAGKFKLAKGCQGTARLSLLFIVWVGIINLAGRFLFRWGLMPDNHVEGYS